jgi:6-methylsalicylate decarboxylase
MFEFTTCCSRRHFFGGAGAVAAAAALPGSAKTAPSASKPHRIDVHHHFLPQEYMREEYKRRGISHGATSSERLTNWVPEQSIEVMDKNGIERAIGSISMPGVWRGDVAAARYSSRQWNDGAAKAVRDHPTRLGFFAVIAPPDTEGALREIEYALDALKADGISLVSNYEGKMLGDPSFAPVLEELNRRKAVVYVHPTVAPCCANLIPGLIPQIIEFPADTTRTITSLLYTGTLARLDGIRWIFSHGGGTLPFLAARIEEIARFNPKVAEGHPEGVVGLLKKVYCDTASAYSQPQLAAMIAFYPPSQILYGSDYPFVPAVESIEAIERYKMPTKMRDGIERQNALKLFGARRA